MCAPTRAASGASLGNAVALTSLIHSNGPRPTPLRALYKKAENPPQVAQCGITHGRRVGGLGRRAPGSLERQATDAGTRKGGGTAPTSCPLSDWGRRGRGWPERVSVRVPAHVKHSSISNNRDAKIRQRKGPRQAPHSMGGPPPPGGSTRAVEEGGGSLHCIVYPTPGARASVSPSLAGHTTSGLGGAGPRFPEGGGSCLPHGAVRGWGGWGMEGQGGRGWEAGQGAGGPKESKGAGHGHSQTEP